MKNSFQRENLSTSIAASADAAAGQSNDWLARHLLNNLANPVARFIAPLHIFGELFHEALGQLELAITAGARGHWVVEDIKVDKAREILLPLSAEDFAIATGTD